MRHIHSLHSFVLLAVCLLCAAFARAATVYVSDQLTIPMRSGPSREYRIIKFLPSGAPLTVLEHSENGNYLKVRNSKGKTGWVEAKQTMTQAGARERIVVITKRLEKARAANDKLKASLADLRAQLNALQAKNKSLQADLQSLQSAYDRLQETAANPLALARKNRRLQSELDETRANEKALQKENRELKDNVMQDWFLIGAGVSIGSLLLGLLITRINWRRRRNSWGDTF